MNPTNRAVHRRHSNARPRLGRAQQHRPPRYSQPPHPLIVQINVTLVPPHQLGRRLTVAIIGSLRLADTLLELAGRILRALLAG